MESLAEGRELVLRINGEAHFKAPAAQGVLRLRVSVDEAANCTFSFAGASGDFTCVGKTFQTKEGGWLGAKVGVFCLTANAEGAAGAADFDYLRFSGR